MSERDPGEHPPQRRPYVPPRSPERPGSSVFDQPTRPRYPDRDPYRPEPTVEYPPLGPPVGRPAPPTPPWGTPPADPYGRTDRYPPYGQPGPYDEPRPLPGRPPRPPRRTRRRDRRAVAPGRRRRPGLPLGVGFLLGVTGLGAFLLALLVLPWFDAVGQDVTLSDIRTAFTIPATDPDDILDSGDEVPIDDGGVPSPDEVGEAVEQEVRRTAAEAAAAVIDTGKARYLELYVETLWVAAAVAVAAAVLFSTVITPRSKTLSLLLGLRPLCAVVTVLAGLAHGVALWIVFGGDGSPEPAFGVWLGVAGLGAVLLATIVGPKR